MWKLRCPTWVKLPTDQGSLHRCGVIVAGKDEVHHVLRQAFNKAGQLASCSCATGVGIMPTPAAGSARGCLPIMMLH